MQWMHTNAYYLTYKYYKFLVTRKTHSKNKKMILILKNFSNDRLHFHKPLLIMETEFEENLEVRMKNFEMYLDRTKMDHKPYQVEGVKWCLNNELRPNPPCGVRGGFIADEMGLGKTIMMIGTMICNIMKRNLIILPPALIDQWFLQIHRTTGHKALVYHGQGKKDITLEKLQKAHIVLATYSAISFTKKQLENPDNLLLHKTKWSRIIFDEAHHLRNSHTSLYTGAKMLKSQIRWLVSGTPVQNKKQDFYNLCSIIRLPPSFYADTNNLPILAKEFILKRTKAMVGIKIPDVHIDETSVVWLNRKEMELSEEIHSALAFSRVTEDKSGAVANSFRGKILSLILRARQSCILPKLMKTNLELLVKKGIVCDYAKYKEAFNHSSKLDAVANSILERKGNGCGKLVFCHFQEEINEIAQRLQTGCLTDYAIFDGRTSASKRSEILNSKKEVLILQIQTGCEGLNLQEHYSEIYFVSPHWNPAVEDQAIARCHRIGQTKPVYVYRFTMGNFLRGEDQECDPITVEKYVNNIQEVKRVISAECM